MKVLDLFSGIGGFSLGLEAAGFETVAFCEIDPFCREWLAQHWPGVPIYSDIRGLRGGAIGSVDLICGGFPCQDISAAGRGEGLSGARSGLWFEMRRLVSELLPVWVVAENVPALRTRGADRVFSDMEELGYTGWPFVVGGDDVRAPQRRKRAWLIFRRLADADRDTLQIIEQRLSGGRAGGVRDEGEAESRNDGGRLADAAGEPERTETDEADAVAALGHAREESRGGSGEGVGHADVVARERGESQPQRGQEGRTLVSGSGHGGVADADASGLGSNLGDVRGREPDAGGIGEAMADAESGGRGANGGASGSSGHADECDAAMADRARHELGGGRGSVRRTRVGAESVGPSSGGDERLGEDFEEAGDLADSDGGGFESEWIEDDLGILRTSRDLSDGRSGSRADDLGHGGAARLDHADGEGLEGQSRASELHRHSRSLRLAPEAGLLWPARPGEPQHGWEAERTITDAQCRLGVSVDGIPARMGPTLNKARLKAAGNSVIPVIPYVIGRVIQSIEQQLREAS